MNLPIKISLGVILAKVGIIAFGLMVVMISIAQVTLRLKAIDDIRNNPVRFEIRHGDGTVEQGSYKLPEVRTLPDEMLYGLKEVRDWLWMMMAKGEEKPKLALLLADKKMAELIELANREKPTKVIETGNEALDKLEYAHGLESSIGKTPDEIKQFRKQLYMAGKAYAQILSGYTGFEADATKYADLLKRIDDWNKKQEEESWQWQI